MVILGIDPSIIATGYAIIKIEKHRVELLECDVFKMASKKDIPERLSIFYDFILDIIDRFDVTEISFETPFLGRNAQNFMKLGYLRGLLLLISYQKNISFQEFSPREIKKAITGKGSAQKEQVARVLMRLFPTIVMPKKFDSTDALGVALCAFWKRKSLSQILTNVR